MDCFEQELDDLSNMTFNEINKQLKTAIKKIDKNNMYLLLQIARGMEIK